MSDQSAQLTQKLLTLFKGEARERTSSIAALLQTFDAGTPDATVVETAFREAHSLKAAAGVVGQNDISQLCHGMESAFAALKRGDIALNATLLACLHGCADALDDFLGAMGGPANGEQHIRAGDLIEALDEAVRAAPAPSEMTALISVAASTLNTTPEAPPPQQATAPAPSPATERPTVARLETVRLAAERLEMLLRQAEELLSDKMVARELARRLQESVTLFADLRSELEKREDGLGVDDTLLGALTSNLDVVAKMAAGAARTLSAKVDLLHEDMKKILTLPCAAIIQPLHRVVRDIARDQKKQAELRVQGAELEIDRRILEELKDPLLHLVRNSIDHGIEAPDERRAVGKPESATVAITVTPRDGQRVEITLSDDGRGVSTQKLAAAAIRQGILAPDHKATDVELQQLMFHSGISTSAMLTDLSGRGLGLAIVRERVERLGGDIAVESEAGKATTFRIIVPLTLATYRGIVASVGHQLFILPTSAVERVMAYDRVTSAPDDERPVLKTDEGPVPVVPLREILELPAVDAPTHGKRHLVMLAGTDRRRIAVEIDDLVGEQEILVKSLGKSLVRVRNVQGATVLATGEIAPILNVPDVLKSAVKILRAPRVAVDRKRTAAVERKNILLAEDSITARSLLRSILESAGYRVKTAVDGVEAWTLLKIEPFDLLVSDVEMPRMNGFDLTARIRADGKLSDLPVVLVTALESRADLERGVDVGANAYIRKGGFEQSQLLEAVRRFA